MNQYIISSLEQQFRKDPSSRVFLRLAEEYRRGGAYEKAIEVCEEGIKHHPNYLPARVCMGRCRQQIGLMVQAEDDYKFVLTKAPDNIHALRGLASIYFDTGRNEESLRHYEMLAIHDNYDEGVLNRILELKERMAEEPVEDQEEKADYETDLLSLDEEEMDSLSDISLEAEDVTLSNEHLDLIRTTDDDVLAPPALDSDLDISLTLEEDELEELEELPPETVIEDSDPLDLEFEKAVQHAEEIEPALIDDLEAAVPVQERRKDVPSPILDQDTLSETEEELLTKGLKHEKMEHFEAARHIYEQLLGAHPNDQTVKQHLGRLEHMLRGESGNRKKIRLLSNWLDKIKGVYYVS